MKTTKDRILATVTRVFPAPKGYRGKFYITAQAYYCGGNQHPHFSVTGEISTDHEHQTGDWQAGGCLHDEALKAWPAIKPLIDLHLSNADDGEPMHSVENGWYWMQGALPEHLRGQCTPSQLPDECLSILSKHLRIDLDAAFLLRDGCLNEAERYFKSGPAAAAKKEFTAFVDAQRPRWKRECKDGLALIQTVAGQQSIAA